MLKEKRRSHPLTHEVATLTPKTTAWIISAGAWAGAGADLSLVPSAQP